MTKFLLAAAAALFLSLSAAQAAEEPNYTDLRSACAEVTVDERDECSYLVARIETAHYEIKFHRRNLLLAATVKNRDVTANSIQNITDLFVVVDNASVSLKTNFSDVWAVTE